MRWQSNSKVADTHTSSTTPIETATIQQHILFLYFLPSLRAILVTESDSGRTHNHINHLVGTKADALHHPCKGYIGTIFAFQLRTKKCWLTSSSEPSLLHEKELSTIKKNIKHHSCSKANHRAFIFLNSFIYMRYIVLLYLWND